MATIKLNPPVKIKIYQEKDAFEFNTLYQVERWIKREYEFWAYINSRAEHSPNLLKSKLGNVINSVNAIKTFVEENKTDEETQTRKTFTPDQLNNLNQRIQNFANHKPIPSTSSSAQRAQMYAENDPNLALAYLAIHGVSILNVNDILNQPHQNQNKTESFNAWVRAQSLRALEYNGQPKQVENEAAELKQVKSGFDGLYKEVSDEIEKLKETRKSYVETFESSNKQLQRIGRQFFEKNRRDIESFKKRYKEELALKEPVTYWTNKKYTHKNAARFWGFAFVSLIIAGVLMLLYQYETLFDLVATNDSGVSVGVFFIIASPFFLYVWVLRILSRLLLGNLKLMRDAEERAVMTETFLSLSDQGGYIADNDRILILHSLFRSATSDNGDDAAPPHWFDVLTNRMRGSST